MNTWDKVQVFEGDNPDVKKYVFEKGDAVAEAVLYRYESYQKRTVLCISTQSGCPVGCIFCGTGKQFNRNLTWQEIEFQVYHALIDSGIAEYRSESGGVALKLKPVEKFQIMFMSMGEPMLNWFHTSMAIKHLNKSFPKAELLVSTMGVDDDDTFRNIIEFSCMIPKVGLQFSVHDMDNMERNRLIPFKNKMNLWKLRDAGIAWWKATGRQVYLNFCLDKNGMIDHKKRRILDMFPPAIFALTFSVICENKEGRVKGEERREMDLHVINDTVNDFVRFGYNVRAFDPAGQDDIGGGCGQLWYVQKWFKERNRDEV